VIREKHVFVELGIVIHNMGNGAHYRASIKRTREIAFVVKKLLLRINEWDCTTEHDGSFDRA